MTAQPTLQAPVSQLLSQVALLIREGVSGWIRPDPFAAPYWAGWDAAPAGARTGCPAGHYLLTAGTRLYLDDARAAAKAPYCVVALNGDPQPMDQRLPSALWRVPVLVEMAWQGDDADAQIRNRLAVLTGLLCTDYPARGAQPARPVKDRLSVAGSLLVYGNDTITDVKPEPLRLMDGHPVARLSLTVLCSALPPEPPPGTIANQTAAITLTAADYADTLDALTFQQTTPGVIITLEPPTDGSRKVITVSHTGTADLTLWPGGLTGGYTLTAGTTNQTLHWDELLGAWAAGI